MYISIDVMYHGMHPGFVFIFSCINKASLYNIILNICNQVLIFHINNSLSSFNSVTDQLPIKRIIWEVIGEYEELIPEVITKQSALAVNISVMDQRDQKSLEDKKTDVFLDEVHKKRVSDEIRQRK